MSAHTPGPWTWFDYPDGRKLLAAAQRAVIHCPDAPIACDPADANLIAAAPELLAAIREVRCHHCGYLFGAPRQAQCQACAAVCAVIAKAEGVARGTPDDSVGPVGGSER